MRKGHYNRLDKILLPEPDCVTREEYMRREAENIEFVQEAPPTIQRHFRAIG